MSATSAYPIESVRRLFVLFGPHHERRFQYFRQILQLRMVNDFIQSFEADGAEPDIRMSVFVGPSFFESLT